MWLREFANETGASVEYEYSVKRRVRYEPGAKESPELVRPKDDPGAKNLCDNYNKVHDHRVGINDGVDEHGKGKVGPKTSKPDYERPPQPGRHENATEDEKRQQQAVDDDRAELRKEREARREKKHRERIKKADGDDAEVENENKRYEKQKTDSAAKDQKLQDEEYDKKVDHSYRSQKAIGNSDKAADDVAKKPPTE